MYKSCNDKRHRIFNKFPLKTYQTWTKTPFFIECFGKVRGFYTLNMAYQRQTIIDIRFLFFQQPSALLQIIRTPRIEKKLGQKKAA